MTKRLYFTCPIKSLYMMKEFGVIICKKNQDVYNWNLADLFNTAGTIYTESARNKAAKEQAELALQIQAQKAAQAKAEAAAKAAESGSVASKIKAYTTPILVVGVLTIGGIAAYFYFKKKKVN